VLPSDTITTLGFTTATDAEWNVFFGEESGKVSPVPPGMKRGASFSATQDVGEDLFYDGS
jgi:hypothetical protein